MLWLIFDFQSWLLCNIVVAHPTPRNIPASPLSIIKIWPTCLYNSNTELMKMKRLHPAARLIIIITSRNSTPGIYNIRRTGGTKTRSLAALHTCPKANEFRPELGWHACIRNASASASQSEINPGAVGLECGGQRRPFPLFPSHRKSSWTSHKICMIHSTHLFTV